MIKMVLVEKPNMVLVMKTVEVVCSSEDGCSLKDSCVSEDC
jgi:hypothetical protein